MLGIYVVLGAITGIMAGMLGLGGGIIIVPALSVLFSSSMPHDSVMHMAIGTSLAIMVFTSFSGMYVYHRRDAVLWAMVKNIFPSLLMGVLLGSLIADAFSSSYLQIFFGIFLWMIGWRMLINKPRPVIEKTISKKMMWFIAAIIGMLSSILGIGGGTMFVPFFLHCRATMSQAIGTSLACGMIVGVLATISFMLHGLDIKTPVPWSTGYIYWPAFFGVTVTSMLLAPVGGVIAHRLPTAMLKKIFALLVLLIAVMMLWKAGTYLASH